MTGVMQILLLGSTGQIGSAILRLAPEEWRITAWNRADLDFSDTAAVRKKLNEHARAHGSPDTIINCAAYTQVDLAESNPVDATKLNVDLPKALAEAARVWGCPLIHYSTDYVYAGDGDEPHLESDPTGALNIYGKTKLLGDQAIQASGADHLIFRTSWVYSASGRNFLLTMLKQGREKAELRVVNDQIGSPTLADDIAGSTIEAVKLALKMPIYPSGVYHLANRGFTSWHGFAEAIFREARALGLKLAVNNVRPIPTREYPTPARRPLNSRLDTGKITTVFSIRPRAWEEALKETVAKAVKGLT